MDEAAVDCQKEWMRGIHVSEVLSTAISHETCICFLYMLLSDLTPQKNNVNRNETV